MKFDQDWPTSVFEIMKDDRYLFNLKFWLKKRKKKEKEKENVSETFRKHFENLNKLSHE